MTPAAVTQAGRTSSRTAAHSRPAGPRPAPPVRPASPAPRAPRRVSGPAGGAGATIGLPGRRTARTPVRQPLRPAPRRAPSAPRIRRRPAAAQRTAPFTVRVAHFIRYLPDHPWLDRAVRGRVWIALLGVMLAGIVAMQVEVLKLGASVGRSIATGTALESRNELLRASVASLADDARIEQLAAGMGMVMPGPTELSFVNASSGKLGKAIANIQAPNSTSFLAALANTTAATAAALNAAAPAIAASTANAAAATTATSTTATTTSATTTTIPATTGTTSTTGTTGATGTTATTGSTAATTTSTATSTTGTVTPPPASPGQSGPSTGGASLGG